MITSHGAAEVIPVTGWKSDVIVEAEATDAASSTTGAIVRGIFVLVEAGYTGSGTPTGTPLAISDDNIVTTKNGTEFLVDPTVDNTIRDESDGGGTLMLVTPGQYQDLQFFITGVGAGDGSGNTAFTATVQFDDATSVVFSAGIGDWQGSRENNAFETASSYLDTRDNTYFGSGLWNREISFDLLPEDQEKTIVSIELTLADRIAISGVSGTPVEGADAPLVIRSLTPVAGETWQLALEGAAMTSYQLLSSDALEFSSRILIENLTQENPEDAGTIGGAANDLITTDENGQARVRFTLSGTTNFVRAEAAP